MSRVLIISPHADDETYGMGGTILKRIKNGDEIYILVVCAGDIHFEHNNKLIKREVREKEFDVILKSYGCKGEMLQFTEESYLDTVPTRDIVNQIERVNDSFKPDVWYIAGLSFHQDHRKVFEACASASRPTRKSVPKEIYSYEHPLYSWNPPVWRFTPQIYEDITDVLDEKIRICKLYESQLRDGALSVKHIREYSVACGTEIGCGASERFEVIRIFR